MMKIFLKLSILSLLLLIMLGCNRHYSKPSQSQDIIARVGPSYLTLKEAKAQIPDYVYHYDSLHALKRYRKQWVNRQLALRKAKDLNLASQKSVQERLEQARQEVLLGALKRLIVAKHKSEISVSDSEVISYFNQHKKKFILNKRFIKFRQVATHDLSTARKARRELRNDSSWVKVAYKYSLNPDAVVRRSKEYWPVSSVFHNLPVMKHYASQLDSGQISPIRRSHGIYRFIQLTDVLEKEKQAAQSGLLVS